MSDPQTLSAVCSVMIFSVLKKWHLVCLDRYSAGEWCHASIIASKMQNLEIAHELLSKQYINNSISNFCSMFANRVRKCPSKQCHQEVFLPVNVLSISNMFLLFKLDGSLYVLGIQRKSLACEIKLICWYIN